MVALLDDLLNYIEFQRLAGTKYLYMPKSIFLNIYDHFKILIYLHFSAGEPNKVALKCDWLQIYYAPGFLKTNWYLFKGDQPE